MFRAIFERPHSDIAQVSINVVEDLRANKRNSGNADFQRPLAATFGIWKDEKHLANAESLWQCLAMATNYEEFYRTNRHGLGEPTSEFVMFFRNYEPKKVSVLDVGCGQGRDALFIARLGHVVTAVDLSPSGISDLQKDAATEGLAIAAEVADIREFKSRRRFDVIVIDRTLHMLALVERLAVLDELLRLSKRGAHVLIADERSNLPAFKPILDASQWNWTMTLERRGFLFVQRN